MPRDRHRRDVLLLAVVALLVLGAGLGLRDPWPADEPRFALVARQMVEGGDWLFPHRGIELYSDKPPMLMWLQATAYTLLRDWRIAFLLPSLLASLGTLWCVLDLGRRLWTPRAGVLAAWALLLTLQFTYQAKRAQIDPLVTFWITLSLYGLLRHLLRGPDWRMWMLGWFAAGLGTITKGVGALALLVLLPAAWGAWRGWPGVALHARDRRAWLGPVAFLLAASLWLLPMLVAAWSRTDPAYAAYVHDLLFRQTVQRYANSWGHQQPGWYFLVVMALLWLPAMLALPWAAPRWARGLRRRDARYLLPLAWWLMLVVFFSISVGKRDVYVMPALPMACLALGPLLPGLLRRRGPQRAAFGFGCLLALVAVALGVALLVPGTGLQARLLEGRGLHADGHALGWILLVIGAWGVAVLAWQGARRGANGLAWMLGGTWVLYGLLVHPLLNPASSARGVMAAATQRIGPEGRLGLVAWKEQNLLMAPTGTVDFGFGQPWPEQLQRGIAWQAVDPARRWLFVQEPALSACVLRAQASFVGVSNRRRWWLVPAAAVVPGCEARAQPGASEDD